MTAHPILPIPAEPDAAPPREMTFVTFVALALTPVCVIPLLDGWGPSGWRWVSDLLFDLPYFTFILLAAQADQNRARPTRGGLNKLGVFLLLLFFPLSVIPFWFAARETTRRPGWRLAFWLAIPILVTLYAAFVFDWTLLPLGR